MPGLVKDRACQIWSDIGHDRSGQVKDVSGLFRERVCHLWVRDRVRQVWVCVSGLGQEPGKPGLDRCVSMVKYGVFKSGQGELCQVWVRDIMDQAKISNWEGWQA